MMANAAKKSAKPDVVEVDAAKWLGQLKPIGGSNPRHSLAGAFEG
jgi:hypothetical protein